MADVHADEVLQFEEGDARLIAHEKAQAESEPDDEITCGGLTEVGPDILGDAVGNVDKPVSSNDSSGQSESPSNEKTSDEPDILGTSVDGGTPQADSPVDSTPTEPSVVPMEVTPLAETPVATESPVVDSPVTLPQNQGNLPNLVLLSQVLPLNLLQVLVFPLHPKVQQ